MRRILLVFLGPIFVFSSLSASGQERDNSNRNETLATHHQAEVTRQPAQQADEPSAAEHTITSQSLLKLGDAVQQYIARDLAVGAELLVIERGEVLFHESYGYSDRESEKKWENDTPCNIRSMTKPITSVAAQILIDRNLLDLDEPVASYLEGFDNEKSRDITVRQVLTHRSGLPLTNLLQPRQFSNLSDQVAAAGEHGPVFPPDSKFWYSDTGTDVVGALIEKISGEPLHEFVSREVFEPLGMTNTFYGIDASAQRLTRAASLYLKSSKHGWKRFWHPAEDPIYPFAWGSQTVYSTTTDYAKLLKMLMDQGQIGERRLLSSDAVNRMLEPISRMKRLGSDRTYPTGFRNLETYYGQMLLTHHTIGGDKERPVVIGHSGSDGTNAWAWPERDLIVLYFTQSRSGSTPLIIEEPIDDFLIHAREDKNPPEKLRPYLGTFIANFAKFDNAEFTVKFRNGKLALNIPGQMTYELLEPDEEGYWAFAIAPERIKVFFDRNENNEVIGLKLHQSGQIFEVPKKEAVPPEKPAPEK